LAVTWSARLAGVSDLQIPQHLRYFGASRRGQTAAVISNANAVPIRPFWFGLETLSRGTNSASPKADLFRSVHLPVRAAAVEGEREVDLRGGHQNTAMHMTWPLSRSSRVRRLGRLKA